MRLPGLYGLHQGVVDEDVLVLRLDQVVPLLPDVEEVREDVNVRPRYDLLQHRMDDNVAASPADTSAKITLNIRYKPT